MNTSEFKSHINDTLCSDRAPLLSTPYLHVDDAMDCAQERALILWHVTEGTYQFMAIHAETATLRQLRALVNGLQEATDLVVLAYKIDGEWLNWTG